jgi:hypothetical protein
MSSLHGSFSPLSPSHRKKIKADPSTSRELGDPGLRRSAALVEGTAWLGAFMVVLTGYLYANKWPNGMWITITPYLLLCGLCFMTGTLFYAKALLRDRWLSRRLLPWLNFAAMYWVLAIFYVTRVVTMKLGLGSKPGDLQWASLAATALLVGGVAIGWFAYQRMSTKD